MSDRNLTIPVTTYFSTAERREQLQCAQSTEGMYRGHARVGETPTTAIFR